mgnify:CR=1 FL=1
MDERHTNRELYFKEQGTTIDKYVLPFIEDVMKIDKNTSILEIGCGEGGNLLPFVKRGCSNIVGIDMSEGKIANAKKYFEKQENYKNVTFIADDIYNIDPIELGQFDIILTRDVLEHIHNQEKFMHFVKAFMKPKGKFFLGFPPWHNPFGGHQQMCKNKFLSRLPYFHILPKFIYKGILKAFGESEGTIEALIEIKDTRITIERFERILRKEKFQKNKRVFYFINPNYEIKFGLKPRVAWSFVSSIPYLRNFWITTNYYVISKSVK